MNEQMKWIVGLGNPGLDYARTRHNAGFLVIDRLAQRCGVVWKRRVRGREVLAEYGTWSDGAEPVRLIKPMTMMNRSGEALLAEEPPIDPAQLLIVCDDVALPLGALRLRPKGGAGGHHGLESCVAACGTSDVARLRVGVGAPNMPRDLTGFVLGPFAKDEHPLVEEIVPRAVEACELWVRKGSQVAMNRINPLAE